MSNHHLFMYYQYAQFIKGYTDFFICLYLYSLCFYCFHNGKLILNHIPVSTSLCPFAAEVLNSQVKHLSQTVIIWKNRLCFRDFSELSVQSFDRICRVNDFADFQLDNQSMCLVYPNSLPSYVLRLDIACPIYP